MLFDFLLIIDYQFKRRVPLFDPGIEFTKLKNLFIKKNFKSSKNIKFWKFDDFRKCQNLRILLIDKLKNLQNYEGSQKIVKFLNCPSFDISHYSHFRQFSYLSFDTNLFRGSIYFIKFVN